MAAVGARIVLAADESPASLAAARALVAAGHRVHAVVNRDDTYVARSRCVEGVEVLRDTDPEAYARTVAAFASRVRADVVLPATEGALRALTGQTTLFEPSMAVGVCSAEALELATSKSAFQRLAAAAGLDTIPGIELQGGERAAAELRGVSYPAIVKPLHSVELGADGRLATSEVRRVDDEPELRALLSEHPGHTFVVQRFVAGTLIAIGGVAWEGRLVCATHQVSTRIWPPGAGVTSYAETVPTDRGRERGVARLLESIGWSGIFGLQFIAADDTAYAIDLNPRIYGSMALAIAAGQNFPAIWVDLLLGRRPTVAPARVGVRYRVEEDDYRALARAFLDGRRREALRGLLPRRGTRHAVFSAGDPRPSTVTLAKYGRKVTRRWR